jgi:Ser/Thr protein kinase RdoA (MazF antagonist)
MVNPSVAHAPNDLREILARFSLPGSLLYAERFGSGHINDTYVASYDQAGTRGRYILQRVNHEVFKNVPELMENISRVTAHIESKIPANEIRRVPSLHLTVDGLPFHQTPQGDFWRVYRYVEGARTYDAVEDPRQAYEAARMFGQFQQSLADLPGGRLHETIPHFHDTPRRLQNLRRAAEQDVAGRRREVIAELDFALMREGEASRLIDLVAQGEIPERVTHNDTKLSNVMLDEQTGEGVCVIDLDTVMPGLSLYDFGDLVRFAANTAAEDETDLEKIDVSLKIFEAIVEGYVAGAGNILTDAEWDHLVFAAKLMTYEVGIRFLTDYLEGDMYFKTRHPKHNLERARNQMRLVDRIEAANGALQAIVRRCRAAR